MSLGISGSPDTATATTEAVTEALGGADGATALVVAFTRDHVAHVHEMVAPLEEAELPVAGMSVARFVAGRDGDIRAHTSGVAVVASRAVTDILHTRRPVDGAGLLLAEPYSYPASCALVAPVAGGYASAALERGGNRLLGPDGPVVDGALLLGVIDAEVVVSEGLEHAGPVGVATRVDGRHLLEIDGRPAIERIPNGPIAVHHPRQGWVFRGADPVSGGGLMVDDAITPGAEVAATAVAKEPWPSEATAAEVFACLNVHRDPAADATAMGAAFPEAVVLGFATGAEFTPVGAGSRLSVHQGVAVWSPRHALHRAS